MSGTINDATHIYNHFLTMPGVFSSRNSLIFPRSQSDINTINYLDHADLKILDHIGWMYNAEKTPSVSMIVIADFSTKSGLQLALNAVTNLVYIILI